MSSLAQPWLLSSLGCLAGWDRALNGAQGRAPMHVYPFPSARGRSVHSLVNSSCVLCCRAFRCSAQFNNTRFSMACVVPWHSCRGSWLSSALFHFCCLVPAHVVGTLAGFTCGRIVHWRLRHGHPTWASRVWRAYHVPPIWCSGHPEQYTAPLDRSATAHHSFG